MRTTHEDFVKIVEIQEHDNLDETYKKTALFMEKLYKEANETFDLHQVKLCVQEILKAVEHKEAFVRLIKIISNYYTTYQHSVHVAFYAAMIGKKIGFDSHRCEKLIFAALFHDVGKIRIDENILEKASILTDEEFEQVKEHSLFSVEILRSNGISDEMILDGVLYHHERADGSGYPNQLRGKQIPKFARIIGMCDVFDALTTHRTFRKSYSSFEALMHMKREMSAQFDKSLITAFIELHR